MACFCQNTSQQLQTALAGLAQASEAAPDLNQVPDPAIAALQNIARWLAGVGLPAAPWQPDEAWLDQPLPTIPLAPEAMATVSALAQLRASVLAQLEIDLLAPEQAKSLPRLVATLNARLPALASASQHAGLPAAAVRWTQLASTLAAAGQVDAALGLNLLPTPPPVPPLAVWGNFLRSLRPLLPLLAVLLQLSIDPRADVPGTLSAVLRPLLRLQLPQLAAPAMPLIANLTSALSAVAALRRALGINPVQLGLAQMQAMVAQRVNATAHRVQSALGVSLPELAAAVQQQRPPYCPTLMATPAVVTMAMSLDPRSLAALKWQVPPVAALPVLSTGLPIIGLLTEMNGALGLRPSPTPCGRICDAAGLLRASLTP